MNSLHKGGQELRLAESANSVLESKQCDTQCNGSGSKNMDPVGQDAKRSTSESSRDNSVSPSNPREHEGKTRVIESVHQFRVKCGLIVNNPNFEAFIVACIALNSLMMGIGTYSFVRDDERLEQVFENIDLVFLIIFTLELGLQFVYHGLRLLLDGWLLFDLVIIVMSWSFQSVQIIRAFRIFRAFRLVTRVKTMKNLIVALFGVLPRMAAISLMLTLVFYIFAVMFTSLFGELHVRESVKYPTASNYFGNMGQSLFTLFQMMTLDDWAPICREVMLTYPWAWFPFVSFVVISGFIVVNLIIAVVCDAIASLEKTEKAMLQGGYHSVDASTAVPADIREQLDGLEEQMEELTRIQARSFHTLQFLTRQMQMHKLKKELTKKSGAADAARSLKRVHSKVTLSQGLSPKPMDFEASNSSIVSWDLPKHDEPRA